MTVTSDLAVEPAESSGTDPDPRRWLVLAVLCLALLVVGIDGTIVNVALPTLVRELGASPRASCSGSSTPTRSCSPASC